MSDEELCLVKPEITQISCLGSESFEERWKICVRVTSKSRKLRSDDGTQYFKVVLEDKSGQIDALAYGSQNVHKFFDRFEEDKVYFISDGKLVKHIKKNPHKSAKDNLDEIEKITHKNDDNSTDGKAETEIGERVDQNGKIQNKNEGTIDENEGKIDENGEKIDENGEKIDETGKKVDEKREKIDENGEKIDENGEKIDENGEKVDENGEKIDENGGKIDESEGKIDDNDGKVQSEEERKIDENQGHLQSETEKKIENIEENVDKIIDENEPKKEDEINLVAEKDDDKNDRNKDDDMDEEYFYEIHLESGTVVTCKDVDSKPTSHFTPITQLRHVSKTFVDVVGIVTGVWKLEMKYTQFRSINITDENGCDVNVALWGKLATDFDVKSISTVVSLKHVRVKKENGDAELQSTPNTILDYKPAEPEAVVLREILGIAEDVTDVENETSHCSRCRKRRGSFSSSVSGSSKRHRNDSGNSSGRPKPKRNNSNNSAMCKRRGNKQLLGRKGRKIYIRKRNSTRDYFKSEDSDSDPSDSVSEDVREVRGRRRPVRHCQSLYSEKMKKKRRVHSSSDDDSEESDDSDDFTSDDTDASEKKKDKKNGRRGRSGNGDDKKKSSQDSSKKDGASSSQAPHTVISIETDDESEVESLNSKPAILTKGEKKWKDSGNFITIL
ncbi:chromosome partition protein Smc-like [Ruditapes philippinarum]|uniref:chromosome partition protein Smc-like n=1 Tax=Ruditapes philippinarum TaxID=129788 RepID=UPI00295BD57F|nr:chromosome partition protein Smc-like [Ruditapes philippinarum]